MRDYVFGILGSDIGKMKVRDGIIYRSVILDFLF